MDEPQCEEAGKSEVRPARRWLRPFTWTGLLAIGWILYELTAQPALGAIAVCLKCGWEDFRTALWLQRRDPDRRRGSACFWLYAANGLCKTAAVAFIMSMAVVGVAQEKGRGQIRGPAEAMGVGT